MRQFTLLFITFSLISGLYSQTWQTINASDFSTIGGFNSIGGGGTIASRWFKLNPYDNSLWMGWNDKIQVLRNDGSIELFDYTTYPILHQYGNMLAFEFTSTHTYVVDENYGLFRFDGNNWSSVYLTNGGSFIYSDTDTVWMSKLNNTNFIQSYDGFTFPDSQSFRRVVSKNGNKWISGTDYANTVATYKDGVYRLYSPDTSNLLSWSNHDFKFAKNNDSLYVAGDLGFSIAYGNKFVDTITPGNSLNMPAGEIIEFEFDSQNNIWAVFGNSSFFANTIAYYDQQSETWTQVYNSSNSPIDFTKRLSIEVDTSGNLWVANILALHVLKVNNPPTWLGIVDNEKTSNLSIYPNPSEGMVTLKAAENIQTVEVLDLFGRLVKSFTDVHSASCDLDLSGLDAGKYLVKVSTAGETEFLPLIKE
jgi:hypothetical protein